MLRMNNIPKKRIQSEKKTPSVPIYFGKETARRLPQWDRTAELLGLNRSTLAQAIADGEVLPVSLGDAGDAARRRARLEALATERGLTVSELFRRIADGEIEIR